MARSAKLSAASASVAKRATPTDSPTQARRRVQLYRSAQLLELGLDIACRRDLRRLNIDTGSAARRAQHVQVFSRVDRVTWVSIDLPDQPGLERKPPPEDSCRIFQRGSRHTNSAPRISSMALHTVGGASSNRATDGSAFCGPGSQADARRALTTMIEFLRRL